MYRMQDWHETIENGSIDSWIRFHTQPAISSPVPSATPASSCLLHVKVVRAYAIPVPKIATAPAQHTHDKTRHTTKPGHTTSNVVVRPDILPVTHHSFLRTTELLVTIVYTSLTMAFCLIVVVHLPRPVRHAIPRNLCGRQSITRLCRRLGVILTFGHRRIERGKKAASNKRAW